jgi:tripartite ATP-independent transporter DctM subunit
MIWLVLAVFVGLVVAGVAVAYAIGAASVLSFIATDNARFLAILPQRFFSEIDVFALMAMPLFILTGEIMNRAGITKALIELAMAMMGRIKGGLGHVNVLASVFLAGISGSAVADAAALGRTIVPAMRERGYSNVYASALTAAASMIGPIIPPSIVMVFYGAIMRTDVSAMFVGGILPGLLLAVSLFAANTYYAHRHNHPGGRRDEIPRFWPSFRHAAPSLSLPFIILGGIVFGVVTPTEAAALAVVAAAVIGLYYGGARWAEMRESLVQTATLTGTIFIILGAVAAFGWLAGYLAIPQLLGTTVTDWKLGKWEYLVILNIIFFVAGTFFEPPVLMALLVPLLGPQAVQLGVDPVHLGIVISLNLTLGLITPPMGGCLLVVSAVTQIDYWALCKAVMPFVLIETLVLVVIVFVPEITLFLPREFGLIK